MTSTSDRAELSTLRSQVEDLVERITPIAERYGESTDSAIATDLFAGERALVSAGRALDQAIAHLDGKTS
jgi:hypothetical protein